MSDFGELLSFSIPLDSYPVPSRSNKYFVHNIIYLVYLLLQYVYLGERLGHFGHLP